MTVVSLITGDNYNILLRPFLSHKLDLFPCSTLASVDAYSSLPDLLAHLCWKLTQQNQNKATDFGTFLWVTLLKKTHLSVLPATELTGLLLLPWEEGLSSFLAGALALIRLSYLFSPLSAPTERWNPPQVRNNLGVRGEGKCRQSNTGACTR